MRSALFPGTWFLLRFTALLACAFAQAATPGPGVSETLAQDRAASIRNLRYELQFTIPSKKSDPVHGSATIRFMLPAPHEVVLDFEQPREKILDVRAAGSPANVEFADGHLIVPKHLTHAGENTFGIEFLAGDEALNRNDDYLYTLFVPARAHLTFPCFDQPDLKARYSLSLTFPTEWVSVANGAEVSTSPGPILKTIRFAETEPLPTYLFAFAAGKFRVETAERNGRTMRMFHRETDAGKVTRNRDALFDLHANALQWLEEYTTIQYPWGKLDFVLLPAFQFGGMEHAGAIFYSAPSMLLEASATQNQMLGRASTISHEVAHMWFGDLVTMRWFNDVWTKEVFANFMAAKIVNPSFPEVNHDLRFFLQHYPSAYEVDRTAGANPIRQPLANIIYDKAPIIMRQLESIVGADPFRDGLREYLKTYSYKNATWPDLVRILDRRTPENLAAWSHTWVEERGRPALSTAWDASRGRIIITQRDPMSRGLTWPQSLQLRLGYPDHVENVATFARGKTTVIKTPSSEQPLYLLADGGGIGYGLFELDEQTRRYFLDHLEEISDPLNRGAAWVNLWENMVENRVSVEDMTQLLIRALPRETNEQNAQLALAYVSRLFWFYLRPEERRARGVEIETLLRAGIARASNTSSKSAWFSAFRSIAMTPESLAWLERLWRREEKIEGLPFAEADEVKLAMELAVREVPAATQILAEQLARTQNPDRKERLAFVIPALSPDPAVREAAFERLKQLENRSHEPWVLDSLRYLHHPLREEHARRFVRPSLDLLREIQATGDIFFPKRWVDAALENHSSPETASVVRAYLLNENSLPQRLRWFVESAADDLFRVTQ